MRPPLTRVFVLTPVQTGINRRFWAGALALALIRLAAAADPLLPWLPQEMATHTALSVTQAWPDRMRP